MRKPIALALALPLAASPLLAIGPASAKSVVKEVKLENSIRRGFKSQAGKSVTVNCPSKVTWVKGKIFYCKAKAADGTKYRVRVKLGNEAAGNLRWKVVA
ncbi:MAG: DUF4333 domain-containing protein [Actinobacteria bacterium]|nr:DUF4333 domain-containing protein [Actinomycetota bacterium]MCB8998134.1 DUF4333 domain-containing protein [Actinomycetota bacterium]MCB9415425.1 DUF4333 domain-containing protein [Actinomycetota bacterium]HRY09631.1 DUF4333 domain-containing protein [Candidatus Nanopelagicales bacterium]